MEGYLVIYYSTAFERWRFAGGADPSVYKTQAEAAARVKELSENPHARNAYYVPIVKTNQGKGGT